MNRIITTTALAVGSATIGLAACSTASQTVAPAAATAKPSTPAAISGTEILHGADTGAAAAANLNSNSNVPLSFPVFTYSGPVNLTVKPFTLPSSNGRSGTNTLPGGLRLHHVSSLPASSTNGPPPATWIRTGDSCSFVATFDKGTYTVVSGSTGKFAGATGHGSYLITATGTAPLAKGKTSCAFPNTGNVSTQGASIIFAASGPITLKQ
jgi:hypothetical protein